VVVIDRILFSVDYPYSPNEAGREFLEKITLAPVDCEKFTHGNAEKLMKIA
jgi:predicted TIM-barrel fold metal-dependent hydrolase